MVEPEQKPTNHLDGKCGCRAVDGRWVRMCAEAREEFIARHERAQTEHRQQLEQKGVTYGPP